MDIRQRLAQAGKEKKKNLKNGNVKEVEAVDNALSICTDIVTEVNG